MQWKFLAVYVGSFIAYFISYYQIFNKRKVYEHLEEFWKIGFEQKLHEYTSTTVGINLCIAVLLFTASKRVS